MSRPNNCTILNIYHLCNVNTLVLPKNLSLNFSEMPTLLSSFWVLGLGEIRSGEKGGQVIGVGTGGLGGGGGGGRGGLGPPNLGHYVYKVC